MRIWPALLLTGVVLGCQRTPSEPAGARPARAAANSGPVAVDADGLQNVFRVSDRVYSGGSPNGEVGFAALARLGVKTVVSVDGAAPDVDTARRHGLRYVHLPVGYDGISRERVRALARVGRELPGPIYVHCHHGKHRGPAAVAVLQLCADPTWDAGRAAAWLKTAGTDPSYTGLTSLPRWLVPPKPDELARMAAELPAVAPVADLTRVMVGVDERWDHLKLVKAAGWAAPSGHPDVDPPHEAAMLVEHYREAGRLDSVTQRGPDFMRLLGEAHVAANELEETLRAKPVATERAGKAYARSAAACTACHAQFRDRPSGP